MPRRAARTDANHSEIIRGLRAAGYVVADTSALGMGFVDATCYKPAHGATGVSAVVWLLEIKRKGGKLTEAEHAFHIAWRHCPYLIIVYSLEDALAKMEGPHGTNVDATRGSALDRSGHA